jgi:glucose/arabinose dehydrogenase
VAAAGAALLVLVGCGAGGADSGDTAATPAASSDAAVSVRPYVRGLESPVHVAAPRGERGRIYVVEQPGRIVVVENGTVRDQPFLDIRPLVRSGGEQGLLSVAFHPGYASNRRFYVNYTDRNGDTNVVEYRSNGTTAIPGTARRLLFVHQPYANHNGGQLAFGPDGRLWVGMGDGGSGGDPENRAQNPRSLLGKLLSINVATKGVRIEALGVRNPWRFSFDRANGDLWIGDVGQSEIEEIDFVPGRSGNRQPPGGYNFGWDVFEGRNRYEDGSARGHVESVITETHDDGWCSIIGGYVIRDRSLRGTRYYGRYVYGDLCRPDLKLAFLKRPRAPTSATGLRVSNLVSFGEDGRGRVYAVSMDGPIYRIGRR